MNRILVLEPYYGGSHKFFLEGLRGNVDAHYTFMTLPARKWKMRMQLSAQWFVEQIKALPDKKRNFDLVFCSSFVDIAVLKALLYSVTNWDHKVKLLTYFHENQFGYPQRFHDKHQNQFFAINFNSALASDGIGFNTKFNRENFFEGCRKFLKYSADMKLDHLVDTLRSKSTILYPGINFSRIDQAVKNSNNENTIPTIVWNHRWEHDKDPETFFSSLEYLERKKIDFRLIVLGESFINAPDCFAHAEKRFKEKIVHFGFAKSHEDYINLLALGDIVVSTAKHEFFGISIIEAVRAACLPVLPMDLSYPELFDEKFLYKRGSLNKTLFEIIRHQLWDNKRNYKEMTGKFSWDYMQGQYSAWFNEHIR